MFNKGNMAQMLKQAQDMQKKIQDVQNELEEMVLEADSGGGMVSVKVNGKQEILELRISDDALKEEKELLEDLIISAANQALSRSQEETQKRMNSATGNVLSGIKLPGIL